MLVPSIFSAIVEIPLDNLEDVVRRAAKLSRRAAKLGQRPVRIVRGDTRVVRRLRTLEGGVERSVVVPVVQIGIIGVTPHVAGWEFVARLEHTEAGNIVTGRGETVPYHYRYTGGLCDHCGTARARKDTFILRDESGHYKQVGRTCLEDFLKRDVTEILAFYRFIGSLSWDEGEFFARGQIYYSTREWVASAISSIRYRGFAKTSDGYSTCEHVKELLSEPTSNVESWRAAQPTDADFELAQVMLDWAGSQIDAGNDYLHNLQVASALPFVASRHQGLLASLPVAFHRAHPQPVPVAVESRHVGEIEQRLDLRVTVEKKLEIVGYDGFPAHMLIMRDGSGNVFVWFASKRVPQKEGGSYLLRGTVKRHNERRGVKQTVLSRCVFKERSRHELL